MDADDDAAGAPGGAAEHPGRVADVVSAIDHVGIAVPDLEEAIRFHTEILGLHLVHREENPAQGVAEAMLASPDDRGGSQVQLLAPLGPDSAIGRFLDRSGPGLQQLAYRVQDIDEASQKLRRRGLRLIYDAARRGTSGSLVNFVHPKDTGGVLIELVQPAEQRTSSRAAGAGAAQATDADERHQA